MYSSELSLWIFLTSKENKIHRHINNLNNAQRVRFCKIALKFSTENDVSTSQDSNNF